MSDLQTASQSCCSTSARPTGSEIRHPLQPLSPDEIRRVADIVRRNPPYEDAIRFETIELLEPSKEEVRAFKPGSPIRRRARVNVSSARKVSVTKMTVDLASGEVLSRKVLDGQRPMIQLEQFLVIEGLVRADPGFIAACAKRGITDMEQVCVDPWSAGSFGIPGEEGRFLCHVFCWLRLRKNEAFYAHPIEGLNAVIDLNSGKVIRIDDYGVTPTPMTEYNYEREFLTEFQPPAKPINVVQPEGVNFSFDGPSLKWRNWSLVVGFNAREALTLHDVRFDGRPVVHRASIVEMTVPYGTPEGGHFRKNVFDVGEYGV
ncbi:MAG: tyramine oxidase, partial [Hyphomicrobium sp.]|nr:tyramine oxidase [Hyphomicrobium sp.]